MQKVKTKLQTLGFTSSHAKLLTGVVAVFAVLFFAKSGISIKTLFVNADDKAKVLTYEDVRNEIVNENGYAKDLENSSGVDKVIEDQLALIDRGQMDGKVLGDAIGIGEIPDADQLLLPEISSQIKLVNSANDDQAARSQYNSAIRQIESSADVTGLLADLNGSDVETIRSAVKGWQWVINELSNTPVPASLADYHKAKITYYSVWMNIGKIYAGDKSDSDMQLLTKAMLSYSQKVENQRADLNERYQLDL